MVSSGGRGKVGRTVFFEQAASNISAATAKEKIWPILLYTLQEYPLHGQVKT
jgi:hypothetical protein